MAQPPKRTYCSRLSVVAIGAVRVDQSLVPIPFQMVTGPAPSAGGPGAGGLEFEFLAVRVPIKQTEGPLSNGLHCSVLNWGTSMRIVMARPHLSRVVSLETNQILDG